MSNTLFRLAVVFISGFFSIICQSQNTSQRTAENKEWIVKSNSYTKILIDIDEKYSPEFGSTQGVKFYDTLIGVPTLANKNAKRKDKENALRFHNFILLQGILPPALIREAILSEFVPAEKMH